MRELVDAVLLAIEKRVWGFTWKQMYCDADRKLASTQRALDLERQMTKQLSEELDRLRKLFPVPRTGAPS